MHKQAQQQKSNKLFLIKGIILHLFVYPLFHQAIPSQQLTSWHPIPVIYLSLEKEDDCYSKSNDNNLKEQGAQLKLLLDSFPSFLFSLWT